ARRAALPRDPRPRRRGLRARARVRGRRGRGGSAPSAHRAADARRDGRRGLQRVVGSRPARDPRRDRLMWGGGGGWGGGGMGLGPPPAAQGAVWGTAPGQQFAGIPPDMVGKVQHLIDAEPDYQLQDVPFTQVVDENEKPFSLGRLLWPRRWPILGVLIL